MTDLTDYTEEDLEQLRVKVVAEQNRRWTISTVPDQMDRLVRDLLAASGQVEGGEWVEPTGYENAYPPGWKVTHNGNEWTSLYAGNILEPGVSGWKMTPVEDEAPPEYKDPAGYLDVYNTGDLVTFEGEIYRAKQDDISWSPAVSPTAWEKVI